MQMNRETLHDPAWEAGNIRLPMYDVVNMASRTQAQPLWLHFGAGNIFRAFIAALQQRLLEDGLTQRGIIAAETFDLDIIDKIYTPYDNLTLNATLNGDASTDLEIIGSVAEAIRGDNRERLREVFTAPTLQMVSFTITEKGYSLRGAEGTFLPVVQADISGGPENCRHTMSLIAALLHQRFQAGAAPLALVSMDNCSHNGEKLRNSVLEIAEAWAENSFVNIAFMEYLRDEKRVAFPWSMIDKITPRPAEAVQDILAQKSVGGMEPVVTDKGTYIAPFVNAERPQYLVVEDNFPAGRPPLEKAGVFFADRDTVNKTERMKVTTCLNPLHTAMAVYGCLLGYTRISEEMRDADIVALIKRLGYVEGLPVVTDPGILSPRAFIDEVVKERLPNPFMPDEPQRIATDTSQKVGIRFGETIKSYADTSSLAAIPLAIAGWFRYLLGVDDAGNAMEVSPDPLKEDLQARLSGVAWNNPQSYSGQLMPILANEAIFGSDLAKTPLASKIESYFIAQLAGPGSVRKTLKEML